MSHSSRNVDLTDISFAYDLKRCKIKLDESNFTNAGTECAREVKNVIDFIDKLKIFCILCMHFFRKVKY